MQQRRRGPAGPMVPAIGLGCLGMSEFHGPRDDCESLATIHRALEVTLQVAELAQIDATFRSDAAAGTRYAEGMMKFVNS